MLTTRSLRVFVGVTLALTPVTATTAEATPGGGGDVSVVHLKVDGRADSPVGLGNPRPVLSWQMVETRQAKAHPCYRPRARTACPADRQTGYEVQAARTARDLATGRLLWTTGRVSGGQQQVSFGGPLRSRDTIIWRARVWDAHPSRPAGPSPPPGRWGCSRRVTGATPAGSTTRTGSRTNPCPSSPGSSPFPAASGWPTRASTCRVLVCTTPPSTARELTDEVLAPGNSNYQLSTEYRTYDLTEVLRTGGNTIGVELGNGTAYVRRSVTNPAVGRTAPYSWWQSQPKGNSVLAAGAAAGATTVTLDTVTGYHVGGTINLDTGGGGDNLESRVITAVDATTVSFTPGLSGPHAAGAKVTGSGNNIAASDPSAGAAVTPRFIGRVEIRYTDGTSAVIVTDRSWRTALGPLVTDAWYSGADHDARREQVGWDRPGSDLSPAARRRDGSTMDWTSAGIAPPPNLATKLVARAAEPVRAQEELMPVAVANPAPGTWVFDLGQNITGWPG